MPEPTLDPSSYMFPFSHWLGEHIVAPDEQSASLMRSCARSCVAVRIFKEQRTTARGRQEIVEVEVFFFLVEESHTDLRRMRGIEN